MLGPLPRARSESRIPQIGRVDGGNIQDWIWGSVSSAAARPARATAEASTAAARTVARLGLTGPFIARAPPQRQSLPISSNVLPLVSGTFVMMKTGSFDPRPNRARLGAADQDSDREHECAADDDLEDGGDDRRVHVMVPDPRDESEFHRHDADRERGR